MSELEKRINEIKPYDLNCNLFSIYDYNGLSYQELLCQFFTKINECINNVNKTLDLVEWLVEEGLKKEVAIKLQNWFDDGTLAEIINEQLFKSLNEKIDKKVEIFIGKELPTNRKEKTIYIKIMEEQEIKNEFSCGNIKISPNLGAKMEV